MASGASAATLPSGFSEQTFSGITNPTALAFAPDGRVFVSQQCGQIRVIKNGVVLPTPFASIAVSCSNERGLHSLAFDPNFASNGFVYARYTRSSPTNNVIGRLQASPPSSDVATSSSPTVIFTVPFRDQPFHHGGGLVVGNDGMLYSSFGDHQSGSGQGTSNLWGKVVRINRDGSIPGDNPFPTASGDNRAIWANGFRNPFTMAIQRGTGRIHVNDVGDGSGSCCEEINNLTRGGNFGWPSIGGSTMYFGYTASSQGGNAITGGGFYNPENVMFPSSYVGRYFFADYGGGWIRSIMGSGSPGGLTSFASGISGPTDVEAAPDGSLWYTARNSNNVRRITFGGPLPPTPTPTATPSVPVPTPTPTPTIPAGQCAEFTGPITATASTSDTNAPANAVDNSLDTRWSGNGDGASLSLDLGSTQTVCFVRVAVFSGNSRSNRFDIQTAPASGGPFTTVLANAMSSGTTTAEETYDFNDTSARVIRYLGHGNNAPGKESWNSVSEVSVWVRSGGTEPTATPTFTPTPTPTGPPVPTPTPTPTTPASSYVEAVIPGANVTASTADANVPANTVDNNLATRWSANGDGQWIRYDLGSTRTVGYLNIAIYQGNMRQNRFDIEVSDGANGPWTAVLTGAMSSGTTTAEQMHDFGDVSARYVRYVGHGNVGASNPLINSVTEVSVFVATGPTPTPCTNCATPTPTPTRPPTGDTPVAINGQLHVCGTKLCNERNEEIQLRGMSTHGLQWHYNCYNDASLDALKNDWRADVLRVSMYVQEGGYETNPTLFTERADTIIQKLVDRGLYANIDWHQLSPGDPMSNLARARTYFTHMATKWGHLPNVTYEICNEPSGVSWARIKEYANAIIPVIRAIDPDGVILVGTRAWSSLGLSDGQSSTGGPNEIINNPVNFPNLMYVFHFYAASHTEEYRSALSYAADRIPMFVTEWGTQTFTGGGGNNFTQSQAYIDLMKTKKISWINWNYSHDPLSGATFKEGVCPSGPFTGTAPLKPAGVWIRDQLRLPDEF